MTSFDEYITNLKLEAERGSTPNYSVPLEKFIKVADNIAARVSGINPGLSMTVYLLSDITIRYKKGALRAGAEIHADEPFRLAIHKSYLESPRSRFDHRSEAMSRNSYRLPTFITRCQVPYVHDMGERTVDR